MKFPKEPVSEQSEDKNGEMIITVYLNINEPKFPQ